MSGSNPKILTRLMVLVYVGFVVAFGASMLTGQDASLFADLAN